MVLEPNVVRQSPALEAPRGLSRGSYRVPSTGYNKGSFKGLFKQVSGYPETPVSLN